MRARHVVRTDEHYTPRHVKESVKSWAYKKGFITNNSNIIDPFYKGGDYTKEDYTNKIVFANPPFSILAEIIRYYDTHNIKYFLYAPGLTLFSGKGNITIYPKIFIIIHSPITYESGVSVNTGFVTNIEPNNPDKNLFNSRIILSPTLSNLLREEKKERVLKPLTEANKLYYGLKISSGRLKKYIRYLPHDLTFAIENKIYGKTKGEFGYRVQVVGTPQGYPQIFDYNRKEGER